MTLAPQGPTPEPEINITMIQPSTCQLLEKIGAGTFKVHESRQSLGKKDLTTMMGTIQRQLRLRPGGDGEWTADVRSAWNLYWTRTRLSVHHCCVPRSEVPSTSTGTGTVIFGSPAVRPKWFHSSPRQFCRGCAA